MKRSHLKNLISFDERFKGKVIIGLDEAGRGPGAGDVFAGAVHFLRFSEELKKDLVFLNDSKKLPNKKREELAQIIKENSIWSVCSVDIEQIEKINILQASLLCMHNAAKNVLQKIPKVKNPYLLVDGNKLIKNCDIEQECVVKGDSKSASIAAASVLAKVERDNYMKKLSEYYPQYDWANNKGYLTPKHLEAIDKYGITNYHRKSFLTKQLKFNLD